MKQLTIPGIGGHLCGELIVDHFCGGGGASAGIESALCRSPDVAINHCADAIEMHQANHPGTLHLRNSIFDVSPRATCGGQPVGLLWTSPACTHFSRARGSVPVSRQLRSLGWTIPRWCAEVRPRVLIAENVPEWQTWGPVRRGRPVAKRAGESWRKLLDHLDRLGYAVEVATLDAADFGAATHRRRLFLVARCDGEPVRWPEPTHGPGRALPWRSAADCLDWSDLGRSIFGRPKPLADATCRRIAAGIVRHVLRSPAPYLAPVRSGAGDAAPAVSGFLMKYYGGVVGNDLRAPLGTITTWDHHALVSAILARADEATTGAHVAAFLTSYYSGGGTDSAADAPVPTIVCKARHALVTVLIDGVRHVITDIRLRMLNPRELATAQGFAPDYRLTGTVADQIARIGNSVCPPIAAALVRANLVTKHMEKSA